MSIDYSCFKKDENTWYGKIETMFCDKSCEIDVAIDSDEETIPKSAKKLLEKFSANLNGYTSMIANAVLDYYKRRKSELGVISFFNDNISMHVSYNEETILESMELTGISIPIEDGFFGDNAVVLMFNNTWDLEHGVAVLFNGNEIVDIGIQEQFI